MSSSSFTSWLPTINERKKNRIINAIRIYCYSFYLQLNTNWPKQFSFYWNLMNIIPRKSIKSGIFIFISNEVNKHKTMIKTYNAMRIWASTYIFLWVLKSLTTAMERYRRHINWTNAPSWLILRFALTLYCIVVT